MKKRLLALLLTTASLLALLPIGAGAYGEDLSKINYLGTEAEYAETLKHTFDENGIALVETGWINKDGVQNKKVGLVDKYGNFVAEPIYDKIEIVNTRYEAVESSYYIDRTPHIFAGGYTQAVRNGKMGLLNTRGEEVVPCKYERVNLPSEGICTVTQKVGDKTYIGYWSLEENRELVAPNKYYANVGAGHTEMLGKNGVDYYHIKPDGYFAVYGDFVGGYALVFTNATSVEPNLAQATIIDKTGKQILPGSYTVFADSNNLTYPQNGPYLIYSEPASKVYSFESTPVTYQPREHGVVGSGGIKVPTDYVGHTVARSPSSVQGADMKWVGATNLIKTYQGKQNTSTSYGAKVGIIDLNNKVILPFAFENINYDSQHKVFTTISSNDDGMGIYSDTGKKLSKRGYQDTFAGGGILFTNGYSSVTADGKAYYVRPDGSEVPVPMTDAIDNMSHVSTGGMAWIKNSAGKYGLINMQGQTVLPFEYDSVNLDTWAQKVSGFAVVTKGGKQGLVTAAGVLSIPCAYDKIGGVRGYHDETYIICTGAAGTGLLEIATGKVIIPCTYYKVGAARDFSYYGDFFALGTQVVQKSKDEYAIVDKSGKELYQTSTKIAEQLNGLNYVGGQTLADYQGRVIYPTSMFEKFWGTSQYTLIVRDGKVGTISANYLDKTYAVKTYIPDNATATPSPTKLMVNGVAIATDSYTIGGNNFIKLRDLATMISGTAKNFSVTYDAAKNAINLVSGSAYAAVGGEMATGNGEARPATRSVSKIYIDGNQVLLTAYAIGGNNYFKLRDVMQAFDVGVGYDAATSTATLTTTAGYELGTAEQKYMKADLAARGTAGQGIPTKAEEENLDRKVTFDSLYFVSTPNKTTYNVGDPFEIAGFRVVSRSDKINGKDIDVTSRITLMVNNVTITDGYKFVSAGKKTVNCYFDGKKANSFTITVK